MTETTAATNDQLLTTAEVSRVLHLSAKTVRALIRAGELSAVKLSPSDFRISANSVNQWIATRLNATNQGQS